MHAIGVNLGKIRFGPFDTSQPLPGANAFQGEVRLAVVHPFKSWPPRAEATTPRSQAVKSIQEIAHGIEGNIARRDKPGFLKHVGQVQGRCPSLVGGSNNVAPISYDEHISSLGKNL